MNYSKRRFYAIALILALSAGWSISLFNPNFTIPLVSAQAITQGPTVNLLYNTSVRIMWTTDSATQSTVEYGTTPSLGSSTTNTTSTTAHEVDLTSLTPNTKYYYRAGYAPTWSVIYEFTTAPSGDESFTFIYFGDHRPNSGNDPPPELGELIDQMLPFHPQFVISGGDMIQEQDYNPIKWVNFQVQTDRFHHNACFWAVTGNHDYTTTGGYTYMMKDYYEWPGENEYNYYSFDYGDSHFIVLSSEEEGTDYYIGSESPFTLAQKAWLEADLAATTASHRFVFIHKPIYPTGYIETQYLDNADWLWQLFEDYKVEAVFASHEHKYYYNQVGTIPQITSGGGGAPLDQGTYWNKYATERCRLDFHFIVIDVGKYATNYTVYGKDGSVWETYSTHPILNQRPAVSGVVHTPTYPDNTQTITVNATATDDAISTVTCKYRPANVTGWTYLSNYTAAPMSNVGGNLYSVNIGPFDDQESYYYFIEANDTAGSSYQTCLSYLVVDMLPPTVTITQPSAGASLSGNYVVVAHIEDGVGAAYVLFYLDNVLKRNQTISGTSTDGQWTWDTTSSTDGEHTIRVVAYDTAGNSAEKTITVTVANQTTTTTGIPGFPLASLIAGIFLALVIVVVVRRRNPRKY